MAFTVIIPARYASTRLPGKALLDIEGQSMLERVYRQASKSEASAVWVATDDQRIVDHVTEFGGQAILTRKDHPSGTDRLQEVVAAKDLDPASIVVNVQGDEPLIPPSAINQVARNLLSFDDAGIATLCEKINTLAEVRNPNAVKVVRDHRDHALYFSRAPIPFLRQWHDKNAVSDVDKSEQTNAMDEVSRQSGMVWYRHIGLYAYRVNVLHDFVRWPVADMEQAECLEQLRALYQGVTIHCAESDCSIPAGIDTPEDLAATREYIRKQSS